MISTTQPSVITEKQKTLEKRAMPVWQLLAVRRGVIRTCINCDFFKKGTEECEKAPGQRPPASVIALGCDSWQEEIPF